MLVSSCPFGLSKITFIKLSPSVRDIEELEIRIEIISPEFSIPDQDPICLRVQLIKTFISNDVKPELP